MAMRTLVTGVGALALLAAGASAAGAMPIEPEWQKNTPGLTSQGTLDIREVEDNATEMEMRLTQQIMLLQQQILKMQAEMAAMRAQMPR
jgi:TolA-binding protein